MNIDDYQRSALRTTNPDLDPRNRLLDASMGLAEEAGEVLGLVRKRAFQQRDVPDAKLLEELGDALWCLAVTADALGLSLSKVAEANQAKLAKRHPDGFRTPEQWSRGANE